MPRLRKYFHRQTRRWFYNKVLAMPRRYALNLRTATSTSSARVGKLWQNNAAKSPIENIRCVLVDSRMMIFTVHFCFIIFSNHWLTAKQSCGLSIGRPHTEAQRTFNKSRNLKSCYIILITFYQSEIHKRRPHCVRFGLDWS